jgi:CRP-like cAMP-binding protein
MAQFPSLSEAERQAIAEQLEVKTFAKGTLLLRDDQVCTECYMVLKGCIRQYRIVDGEEKTTQLYTEGQAVVLFASYTSQSIAGSNLVCVEDCTAIVGDMVTETEMYAQFPQLREVTRSMMEQGYGRMQEEFATFMAFSPEERYQHLLAHRPDLLLRVPQHQIASYIGVTPESLSRIRKRLAQSR